MTLQTVSNAVSPERVPPFLTPAAGRYEPLSELGRGGMGVVYKARDRRLDRIVAIKCLPREWTSDEVARERFLHEAQAASAIDHPNICTIHDIGSTKNGQLFIVMAHYEGETLKQRLERDDFGTREIISISSQIASGLDTAHRRGIVHRDIKPGNIFLCANGVVKVVDFGLALRSSGAQDRTTWFDKLDTPGRPFGTVNYMAPERILETPVDPRSDVFSLGVVMYEMASKRRPFAGASSVETLVNVLTKDPEPLRLVAPSHPAAVGRIVHKCLAKDSNDRFQSASDLARALGELQSREGRENKRVMLRAPYSRSSYGPGHLGKRAARVAAR